MIIVGFANIDWVNLSYGFSGEIISKKEADKRSKRYGKERKGSFIYHGVKNIYDSYFWWVYLSREIF